MGLRGLTAGRAGLMPAPGLHAGCVSPWLRLGSSIATQPVGPCPSDTQMRPSATHPSQSRPVFPHLQFIPSPPLFPSCHPLLFWLFICYWLFPLGCCRQWGGVVLTSSARPRVKKALGKRCEVQDLSSCSALPPPSQSAPERALYGCGHVGNAQGTG